MNFVFVMVQNRNKRQYSHRILSFFPVSYPDKNENRRISCFVICNLYSTKTNLSQRQELISKISSIIITIIFLILLQQIVQLSVTQRMSLCAVSAPMVQMVQAAATQRSSSSSSSSSPHSPSSPFSSRTKLVTFNAVECAVLLHTSSGKHVNMKSIEKYPPTTLTIIIYNKKT